MNLETYMVAAVAGAVLFLFAIIQPGLAYDRRKFGEKTYSSVEGMFMVGDAWPLWWEFSAGCSPSLGHRRRSEKQRHPHGRDNQRPHGCSNDGSCNRGHPPWARLRAAFRKEQQASLRIAHDSLTFNACPMARLKAKGPVNHSVKWQRFAAPVV